MKNINKLKSTNAAYSDGTYLIINVHPYSKPGTWLVVNEVHKRILFASSTLSDAKRYVASYTFYGKDVNLQRSIDKTGSLREKLNARLKILELEMMSKEEMREFLRSIPRVKFGSLIK